MAGFGLGVTTLTGKNGFFYAKMESNFGDDKIETDRIIQIPDYVLFFFL
jgi:hypothetical protein